MGFVWRLDGVLSGVFVARVCGGAEDGEADFDFDGGMVRE
jgi:hypothetical protein